MPANLPRREVHHEPEDTTCGCGTPMQRIGEDVAEKLDYQPGVFTVERHIRGKWVRQQRQKIPDGSATARAIDYSLNRWVALTRFLDDGDLPIDNNWVENRIRPIAIGRQNWLFAGSLRAGKRAAAGMSLIHSAKLNGLDPYAYMRYVLERLPTQPASRITELLPHHWQPITSA
ncbi:IS66 family transposase [Aquabacterium sp. OR-4]|uniref:IS66 family transposase n=1 Tax=Aquabacterium sp. OR-4 TaxID=2978127 RepID=UPI003FCDDC14